jgi:hypothetical protein
MKAVRFHPEAEAEMIEAAAKNIQTVTLGGQRFVILPEADYRELLEETWPPALPVSALKPGQGLG